MDFLRPTWRWINRLTILAWGNWSWTRKGFMLLFHLRIVLHVIHGVISAVKWRIAVSSWRQYQFRNRFVISIFLNSALSNTVASFPGSSDGKVSACNAGDLGLIPGLGRSPGEGNGSALVPSTLLFRSSTRAWKMPWMEERGRLQSMGSQRVRHD